MDKDRLYEILAETTVQLRKGAEEEEREAGPMRVVEVFAMPHEAEAGEGIEKVDMELLVVGVDKAAAERRKADLLDVLRQYPQPDRLAAGPSYIEVGAQIGDQGAAFQLFALGKVLGLWDVMTPARFGLTGADARAMAGTGFVMMTGFHDPAAE